MFFLFLFLFFFTKGNLQQHVFLNDAVLLHYQKGGRENLYTLEKKKYPMMKY